jgi:hypothetical protein
VTAFAGLLNPGADIATIGVVILGLYLFRRQEFTQYGGAKRLLVLISLLILGVVVVRLFEDIDPSAAPAEILAVVSTSVVFIIVGCVCRLAQVIYIRPSEPRFIDRLRAVLGPKHRLSGLLFVLFSAYLVCLVAYVVLFRPFTISMLRTLDGGQAISIVFSPDFVPLLLVFLVGFLGFAEGHLLLAARRLTDPLVARTLRVFALGWVVAGLALFFLVGLATRFGINASGLGYLITSVAFATSLTGFRRASALEEFFLAAGPTVPTTLPFTRRVGIERPSFQWGGRTMLLEFDPSSAYEEVVKDFVSEQLSTGGPVFIFTSRGKPIHNLLLGAPNVRFFVMTGETTYPKPGGHPLEVLVPQHDSAILLDLVERSVASDPELRIGLVFDSLSDVILGSGFEDSYKFLRQVLAMTSDPRVTALFILLKGAHDEKIANIVMSLFTSHLTIDADGLRITRSA